MMFWIVTAVVVLALLAGAWAFSGRGRARSAGQLPEAVVEAQKTRHGDHMPQSGAPNVGGVG